MLKKLITKILVLAFWLAVWQLLCLAVGQSVLLPSPMQTLRALVLLAGEGAFWLSVGASVLRIVAGFLIGAVLGVAAAVLMSLSGILRELLRPLLSLIVATPIASLIILALVWLKVDNIPVFAAALIVMPGICSNVSAGITGTDRGLLEMAEVFGMKKRKILTAIYIPSVKPFLSSAAATGVGMAWKAGVAAEVLCTPKSSIGAGLYDSKIYLETPQLFAWTAVVIVLSIILGFVVKKLLTGGEKRGG